MEINLLLCGISLYHTRAVLVCNNAILVTPFTHLCPLCWYNINGKVISSIYSSYKL